MKIHNYIILLYFFTVPFDGWSYLSFSIFSLNVSLSDITIVAMILSYLLAQKRESDYRLRINSFGFKIFIAMLFAFTLSMISLFYAYSSRSQYDIKISLNILEHSLLVLVLCNSIIGYNDLKKCIKVFISSNLMIALFSVLASVGVPLGADFRRTSREYGYLTIGVKKIFGISGMMEKVFVLPFCFNSTVIKSGVTRLIIFILFSLAIFSTFDRSTYVAAVFQLFSIAFIYPYVIPHKSSFRMLTLALSVSAAAIVIINIDSIIGYLIDLRQSTVDDRIRLNMIGLNMFANDENSIKWLFGYGKGVFMDRTYGVVIHNFYVDILVSKGIIMFILLLCLFGIVLYNLAEIILSKYNTTTTEERFLSAMFLVVFLGFFCIGMFTSMVNSKKFWTSFALICCFIQNYQRKRQEANL